MMKIDVCHSLTGELLDIELPEGALVEELRNALKVSSITHHVFLDLSMQSFLIDRPN